MLASNNLHFPSNQSDNHMEHRLVCIQHHGSRSNRHKLSLLVHNVPLQTLRDRRNCNFLLGQSHCKFHSGTKSCWSHHTWSEVCHRSTHWCWKMRENQLINQSLDSMYSGTNIFILIYIYTQIHKYINTIHTYIHTHIHTHTYTYIHTLYTHIHHYIYTYIHTYIHIHIYIHIYIHTHIHIHLNI